MRYGPSTDHLPQLRLSISMDVCDNDNIILRHAVERASKTIPLYGQATDEFIEACSDWFEEQFEKYGGIAGLPPVQARVEFYAPGPQRYTTSVVFDQMEMADAVGREFSRETMRGVAPMLQYFAGMEMPIIDPVREPMWMFKKRTWREKLSLCWWILRRG